MCGTLRHENRAAILPDDSASLVPGKWEGHARQETLAEKFLKYGFKEGKLSEVNAYTEGYGENKTWFSVPKGQAIKIIYHPDRQYDGKHPYHIVTRPATEEEFKQCKHPRFPVLVSKSKTK